MAFEDFKDPSGVVTLGTPKWPGRSQPQRRESERG